MIDMVTRAVTSWLLYEPHDLFSVQPSGRSLSRVIPIRLSPPQATAASVGSVTTCWRRGDLPWRVGNSTEIKTCKVRNRGNCLGNIAAVIPISMPPIETPGRPA